jgi:hypothetical protein
MRSRSASSGADRGERGNYRAGAGHDYRRRSRLLTHRQARCQLVQPMPSAQKRNRTIVRWKVLSPMPGPQPLGSKTNSLVPLANTTVAWASWPSHAPSVTVTRWCPVWTHAPPAPPRPVHTRCAWAAVVPATATPAVVAATVTVPASSRVRRPLGGSGRGSSASGVCTCGAERMAAVLTLGRHTGDLLCRSHADELKFFQRTAADERMSDHGLELSGPSWRTSAPPRVDRVEAVPFLPCFHSTVLEDREHAYQVNVRLLLAQVCDLFHEAHVRAGIPLSVCPTPHDS